MAYLADIKKFLEDKRFAGVHHFLKKHERHIPFTALLFGFVWDTLTLGRPDQWFENIVLIGYLIFSAVCIALLHFGARRATGHPLILSGLMQFAFGNLAGGLIVLYGRSGTFTGSALFFVLFGAFLVGNEFLRSRYARAHFHISAWYFLLLVYMTLIVPVLLGKMGDGVFLLSGALSLLCVMGFIALMNASVRKRFVASAKSLALPILSIYIFFNLLYFTNAIPPVPLALKSIGIYHLVERLPNRSYRVSYEGARWFEPFQDTSGEYHAVPGSALYCFSSVFAPAGLSAPVYHRWEYFNESAGEWETNFRISFSIIGGRETGYRGFSLKTIFAPGKWRCTVETERGALIGRRTFKIIESTELPSLLEEIL